MRVLVTGGGGQLARALTRTAPPQAVIFAPARAELDVVDVRSVAATFDAFAPTTVINTAAYTAVDQAESERAAAFRANADGPRNLADACRAQGARFVHVSTDYVFDGSASRPYPPEHPRSPRSVYGQSKAAGEAAVAEILPEATIVRTAWVYSRDGNNFVNTMRRLLAEREELTVVCDQVGAPTWADNLARVLWSFAARPAAGVFHYTDAGVASWYDFAIAVAEEGEAAGVLAPRANVLPVDTSAFPRPAPRPAFSVLDCRSTHAHTGIAPEHWRRALRRMLAELREAPG